jgi:hypothetical protein
MMIMAHEGGGERMVERMGLLVGALDTSLGLRNGAHAY